MRKLPLLIASALFLTGAARLSADEVKLTTALSVGESMNIALNADLNATLTWGNGETQTLNGDGHIVSLEVKDANLTITSTNGKITALYVQGNKLTALNVIGAPNLVTLLAADNEIEELALTKQDKLTTLDLQGNLLDALNLSYSPSLTDLNVGDNTLQGAAATVLKLASGVRPTHYVASENVLTSAASSTILSQARTVWVDHNQLTTLNLGSCGYLRSVDASNNGITRVTLPNMEHLTDFAMAGNKLTTLDFSKGTGAFAYVDLAHNDLGTITWDTGSKQVKYAYLNDNALCPSQLPTTRSMKDANVADQANFDLGLTEVALNTAIDLSDFIQKNGWGVNIASSCKLSLTNAAGETLTEGTDYTYKTRKLTLLTDQAGVQIHITNSSHYSGVTFTSTAFTADSPTEGINDVTADDAITLTVGHGTITAHCATATPLTIVSAAGQTLVKTVATAGSHTWSVAPGVYVVNGHKVVTD